MTYKPLPEHVTRIAREALARGHYTSPGASHVFVPQTEELAPELPFSDVWTVEPDSNRVIPAMGIAPGPVHLVTGSWYTGKTLFLLSKGLAVASGRSVFGVWGTKRGKWMHFDHEMGRRHIKRYLQRLARGMGIEPEDVSGHMSLRVLPQLNLVHDDAVDHYSRLLEGYSLATIDPLRAAAPGADENDSEFRQYLDRLSIVSDRTGCAIEVLHHGGKPQEGSARRNTGRGTSAIDDAVQTKFVLTAKEKGAPIEVSHEKTRELDQPLNNFFLRIENQPGSVQLVHLDPEQMQTADPLARVKSAIFVALAMARSDVCTRNALASRVSGRRGPIMEALREMFETGDLVQIGSAGPIRKSGGSQNG